LQQFRNLGLERLGFGRRIGAGHCKALGRGEKGGRESPDIAMRSLMAMFERSR
jgi:hypothetical protein